MSLSSSRHVPWVLAVWFAATAFAGDIYAQGTPRPRRSLELTETNSAEILTNLSLLRTKKEGMNELDDQLKALKKFSSDALFEGNWYVPYVPQTGSKLSSKAVKELLQRQNNWGLSPEEMGFANTRSQLDSDTFSTYGDNTGDKDNRFGGRSIDRKSSSLQQFYDALNNRNSDRTKQDHSSEHNFNDLGQDKHLDNRRDSDSDDDSALPDGIRDKARKLKDMVNDDKSSIFSPTRARSSFDDFFGLSDENGAREQVEPMKQGSESFIDQFKKTLDRQSAASSLVPGMQGLNPNTDVSRALVPGLEPIVASSHRDFLPGSSGGNSTSLADPTALRDINSSALNQWNSQYQAPKLVLPQPVITPSSATVMQVPRRQF